MNRFARWSGIPIAIAFIALQSGCQSFTPVPLETSDVAAVLASPDREVLAREAAGLQHPRLAPLQIDFAHPLTAQEIAVLAVLANPDLRARRAQQQVADAQVFAAGLLPDPQFGAGLDRLMAPAGLANGYNASLAFDLAGALGTRGVERQAQRLASEQIRMDIAWDEWSTAGQAALLAERLPYQQRAAVLAEAAAGLSEKRLASITALSADGDIAATDIEARRISATDDRNRAYSARRDAEATQQDLLQILGMQPGEPLAIAGDADATAWISPDPEMLFQMAGTQRLDLLALKAGYDSQQAQVHRAILGQYPRVAITLNRSRDTSHVHTFGPAITLDLPLWNRNRGEIAIAESDREQLRLEYAARLHQTRADIAALVAQLDRDEAALGGLNAQLISMDRNADAYDQAAALGDLQRPFADSMRAAAVDHRLTLIGLQQACAEERIALAIAVGAQLYPAVAASIQDPQSAQAQRS